MWSWWFDCVLCPSETSVFSFSASFSPFPKLSSYRAAKLFFQTSIHKINFLVLFSFSFSFFFILCHSRCLYLVFSITRLSELLVSSHPPTLDGYEEIRHSFEKKKFILLIHLLPPSTITTNKIAFPMMIATKPLQPLPVSILTFPKREVNECISFTSHLLSFLL